MTQKNSRLLRHLGIAVVVKLAFLALLWWMFVRDAQVTVDAERVAARIETVSSTKGEAK